MRGLPVVLLAIVVLSRTGLPADFSPTLQWVKTLGGSDVNTVTATATDAGGNLYIVGNTLSLDFPVAAAAQPAAGGSTLVRINTETGAVDKLYSPALSKIRVVAADPRNPETLYATAGGDVLRSSDAGSTWALLSQVAPGASVFVIAVDPSNSNVLYAGTNTQGAFTSNDGGLTWTAINNGIPAAHDGTIRVDQIWVDPKFPEVLFAPAENALLRSANGGATWTVVARPLFSRLLAFDPFVSGTLYLARLLPDAQLLKSTDDGRTFKPVAPLPDQTVTALLADPFHPGVLFAVASPGTPLSSSAIYQSVDSGLTWIRKATGGGTLAADPNGPALYAVIPNYGIVRSTDGFSTASPIGTPRTTLMDQILVAGPNLFVLRGPSTDVFAVKLDANGDIVYSTYFGGSLDDTAAAAAVGPDGSLYVTGTTLSADFPATAGAYATVLPAGSLKSNFVFKLNPDGSLGWATYFADSHRLSTDFSTTATAIAVDSAGNPYIGGSSGGDLPTTPGAYQTEFQQRQSCTGGLHGCSIGPTSAFVTKFDARGAGPVYSTYVPTDEHTNTVTSVKAMVVDANGNAWFAAGGNVVELNAAGSALLASRVERRIEIAALALDSQSNVYAVGTTEDAATFPATPEAFQRAPQPALPNLPDQLRSGYDAFVMKWDGSLSQVLAATLLGGELADTGTGIAIDGAGNVIVCGSTDSKAFPTRAASQTMFAPRSGFVAGLDSSLSHLLFSTYLGDGAFEARGVGVDGDGNILLAGSTLSADIVHGESGDPGKSYTIFNLVAASKIALPQAPEVRLDSVVHFASRLAGAVAPGEPIMAVGEGFGPDAQLLVDGAPLTGTTATGKRIVAVMPDDAKTTGTFLIQVSSGGTLSNPMIVPAAPAAPGIYSVDGSGFGQGYILNSDGTLNSPTNPAAPGSAITIFAAGVGRFTLDGPYAVTALTPTVFIVFYANGIAAHMGPVAGLPGNVYRIEVFVPDPAKLADRNPDLQDFKMPPQVGVKLIVGPLDPLMHDNSAMISQPGIVLNVK